MTPVAPQRGGGNLPMPVAQALLVLGLLYVTYAYDFYIGACLLVLVAAAWPPAVPWRPLPVARVLLTYIVFAVAWLAFVWLYLHAAHALGFEIAPQPMLQELAEKGAAMPNFALVCLGIVVIAPLLEEVVFRGYLFTALGFSLPPLLVHLVTATLFGLVHGAAYALPIGVLALLFGWLRAKHGSLLPSVLAHAVHNGLTVLLALCWPGHLDLLYPR